MDAFSWLRRRMRLQFSLRLLLIAVTAVSILLGWLVYRAQRQAQAIAIIEQSGGTVIFTYQRSANSRRAPPSAPAWLRRIGGEDMFRTVFAVEFDRDRKPSPQALEQIRYFSRVTSIELDDLGEVTEQDLIALSKCQQLKSLGNLEATSKAPPEGLRHIGKLRKLERLNLISSPLAGVLHHLEDLTNLKYVSFYDSHLRDDDLRTLRRWPRLEELALLIPTSAMPLSSTWRL